MAKQKSTPAAQGSKITKIDAVRRALAELGKDATPTAIQGYLKDRLSIEITRDHASTAKGVVLRQGAKKMKAAKAKPPAAKPAATKAKPQPPVQLTAATASPAKGGSGNAGIQLEDIAATKALLGRVGADELRKLIDLLAE